MTVTVEADVATNMLFTTHFMSPLTPAVHEAVEKIYGMLKAGSDFTRECFVKNGA